MMEVEVENKKMIRVEVGEKILLFPPEYAKISDKNIQANIRDTLIDCVNLTKVILSRKITETTDEGYILEMSGYREPLDTEKFAKIAYERAPAESWVDFNGTIFFRFTNQIETQQEREKLSLEAVKVYIREAKNIKWNILNKSTLELTLNDKRNIYHAFFILLSEFKIELTNAKIFAAEITKESFKLLIEDVKETPDIMRLHDCFNEKDNFIRSGFIFARKGFDIVISRSKKRSRKNDNTEEYDDEEELKQKLMKYD